MPLRSPKRRISDAENKLRLLYAVHVLGQVTETQLWPFVASLDLMDYIPMQLLLHELFTSGDLALGAEALSGLISLSAQGEDSLRLFKHRIMLSDREMMDSAAPAYRAQLEKRRQVRAVYESAREGDYHVLLSLTEGELPVLSIRVATASREYASRSLRAFESSAASILSYLYGLGPIAKASQEQAAKPEIKLESLPTIVSHSPHEHTLTACLWYETVCFEISLLLPDFGSATALQCLFTSVKWQKEASERLFSLLCVG